MGFRSLACGSFDFLTFEQIARLWIKYVRDVRTWTVGLSDHYGALGSGSLGAGSFVCSALKYMDHGTGPRWPRRHLRGLLAFFLFVHSYGNTSRGGRTISRRVLGTFLIFLVKLWRSLANDLRAISLELIDLVHPHGNASRGRTISMRMGRPIFQPPRKCKNFEHWNCLDIFY